MTATMGKSTFILSIALLISLMFNVFPSRLQVAIALISAAILAAVVAMASVNLFNHMRGLCDWVISLFRATRFFLRHRSSGC